MRMPWVPSKEEDGDCFLKTKASRMTLYLDFKCLELIHERCCLINKRRRNTDDYPRVFIGSLVLKGPSRHHKRGSSKGLNTLSLVNICFASNK